MRAADWTEQYAYDQAGNLTTATWPSAGIDVTDSGLTGSGLDGPGAAADLPGTTAGAATAAPRDVGDARGRREYTGTLLRRAGNTRYEYDGAGRLILRQQRRLSNKPLTWRYTWDSEDRLLAVTTPDGTVWRYRYDPLGRRVAKQHLDPTGAVVAQVDYAWDGPRLVEQTHHRPTGTHTSTWDYLPDTFIPITQTDTHSPTQATVPTPEHPDQPGAPTNPAVQWGQPEIDRRFYAIVTDLTGTPTELVTLDGRIAWQQRTTIWGTPTHTSATGVDCPLRFPGQLHDPETGTAYNHHRYYDPETARYHTPDPLGLVPSPNPHTYVANPTIEVDPLGLAPCRVPHRQRPRIEDGNLREGWQHIDARHITGNHPHGPGDLFAPGTTRAQLSRAAEEIVARGTRIRNPSMQLQVFELRMKVNGLRGVIRIVVDSDDANRVITIFPVGGYTS